MQGSGQIKILKVILRAPQMQTKLQIDMGDLVVQPPYCRASLCVQALGLTGCQPVIEGFIYENKIPYGPNFSAGAVIGRIMDKKGDSN